MASDFQSDYRSQNDITNCSMVTAAFPQLEKSQEESLVDNLLQWSLANGLVIYPPNFKSYQPVSAPTTLYPTPFPKVAFQDAKDVQLLFNELYAKVASDEKFLFGIIDELAQFDSDFTGKLWETYIKAKNQGIVQPLSLGIFRSDYMVNEIEGKKPQIKQIEFNTVSVSFGGLSEKVGELHNYLNNHGDYSLDEDSSKFYKTEDLPISDSIKKLSDGLADGDYYYNNQKKSTGTIVLVVVQDRERNVFDQRLLEFALLSNHGIKSIRLTLSEIESKTFIEPNSKKLFIKSTNDEVSVVYFRSGYAPTDFNSQKDWDNRLILETSKAIKAPTLLTQLAGAKKIQQILTDEEIISKFITKNPETENNFSQLLDTFVAIYPLDNSPKGLDAKKLALETPDNFVLKPQREGGGNNIYKQDIPNFLKSIPEKDWAGYILMELIHPQHYQNKILRDGEIYNEPIISELGRFGTIVFNQESGEILSNNDAGWLLRSKFESSNEGGVAAGFGCVDSVVLN
ncbi:Glutathione synthetase [Wickerhamomyces ciferrii]|uniref:Glutathione synthetase n=1 Tax=Wickerhamomyces ciferrii (strain ATCC 14091 / BCRC 22168 / CBS 111 / JCM 3599 / NBRC 0793 / NRRL Y-1031 F-60-10) TaxID=1206466 RepID=K0KGF0_WICCF|nr:Glutathione synthetase [Wickerhamomyces ciferrii]CCH40519.1 Glutathione synthetase [Wickerhamomyces ciferrii]